MGNEQGRVLKLSNRSKAIKNGKINRNSAESENRLNNERKHNEQKAKICTQGSVDKSPCPPNVSINKSPCPPNVAIDKSLCSPNVLKEATNNNAEVVTKPADNNVDEFSSALSTSATEAEKTAAYNPLTNCATLNQDSLPMIEGWVNNLLAQGFLGICKEFRSIQDETVLKPEEYQSFSANQPKGLNRYKDVYCVDHRRVMLRNHPDKNDYIHANFVGTPVAPNRFICTQAPKTVTMFDFWLMVLQEEVEFILMLGEFMESGKRKCAEYVPLQEDQCVEVRDFRVKCISKNNICISNCTIVRRQLSITKKSENIDFFLTHYHWSDWPDHGVPKCDQTPLKLLHMIRQTRKPIMVHCSAGVGRTGCIVTIEYLLECFFTGERCDSTKVALKLLRRQRAGFIQTELQYLYVHRVLLVHLLETNLTNQSGEVSKFMQCYDQMVSANLANVRAVNQIQT